ncbi:MAG TPA: 16S rRNA (uracil(1498)-N(3))-methyltransferase [Leucothrix mucor]|nr:16S rRNA (uracil(1498)-N(3))-methyltransferase [Leucothrix mucor]
MRIPRFYTEQTLTIGLELDLTTDIHRHAIQVLRLKVDEEIVLFNGQGGEYLAQISLAEKRRSSASIISFNDINRESPLNTTLALAMIKSDKMDFAIQKAVEMGVNCIQPLYTNRSVINIKTNRLEKKTAHWQSIIKGACEQSGRTSLPLLKTPLKLEPWLQTSSTPLRLAMLPGEYPHIKALSTPPNNEVTLIVGPEGGFNEQEVDLLLASNVTGIQFGPRILRAETAVIAGLSLCQQQWGDL